MGGYTDDKGRFRKIGNGQSAVHSSDIHSNNIKRKKPSFNDIDRLSHVQRTKLEILAGKKPSSRPDLYFPANVLKNRDLINHLSKGNLNKPIPFDKEILGIQSKENGQKRITYIHNGDVHVKNFDNIWDARKFEKTLKQQGFKSNQENYSRVSGKEFDEMIKAGRPIEKVDENKTLDVVGYKYV